MNNHIFLFPTLIFLFSRLIFAQPELYHLCIPNSNFTANSTFQKNLSNLLSAISADTVTEYGFYTSSSGQNSDKVNAIGLCRGDVKPDVCRSCIKSAAGNLTNICPNQKEAIIWYDDCMLRYSNRSINGVMELGPYFWMYNLNNISDTIQFNKALFTLLNSLKARAASGGSLRKFATGNVTTEKAQSIYGLVQCTPDLSESECVDCLTQATALLPKCCDGKQGGRVVGTSCNFRYEINQFYDSVAEAAAPSPAASNPSKKAAPSPAASNPSENAASGLAIPSFLVLCFSLFLVS